MNAADIAKALGGKANGAGFMCRCPAHDDKTASLKVDDGRDGLLVHCHAGCDQSAVIAALKDRGLWPEREVPRTSPRIVGTYDYRAADGTLVYQVVRLDPKSFRQRRPDGANGWAWNLADTKPLPYRLPELRTTIAAGYCVFIVEGEKDVEALRAIKIDATCNSGGAKKWRPELAEHFAGAHVVILPDNDRPGREHAEQVAANLAPVAASVKVLALPNLPPKGDVSDWLASGGGADQLVELAFNAPAWSPSQEKAKDETCGDEPVSDSQHAPRLKFRTLAELIAERREPQWLIRNVLEAYVLAVMAGHRGSFKSFIALHWAMTVAMAGFGVLILSGEGAGLDRRADAWLRTHAPTTDPAALKVALLERPLNLTHAEVRATVAEAIQGLQWAPALILIDTLSKFSPGMDENDNAEVASYLSALATEWRDTLKCTVLLVAHTGHGDGKRPRGASSLMANPDAEYIVERPAGGMAVTISRERFKDTASQPPLAYMARVVDLGRVDRYGDPVTSLVLDDTEAPATKPATKGLGRNQERALAAIGEWTRSHPDAQHIASIDLKALLDQQGLKHRARRAESIEFLTTVGVLRPSAAGHAVNREALQ